MNKRLREQMKQKGPEAAKRWAKEYEENVRHFDSLEYKKANKEFYTTEGCMKYKIRVFDEKTNKEAWTVDEVYESEEIVELAIELLKQSFSRDYLYVKVPVVSE